MQTFGIGEAVGYGWSKVKAHFFFLWMMLGTVWLVAFVLDLLQKGAGKETLIGTLLGLIAIAVGFIMQLGLIRAYLNLDDGTESKLDVLLSQRHLAWRYFGAMIIYGIAVVIGLILLVIPGIYIALKYQFFGYLIVDKNLGAVEALKKSAELTVGVKWKLIGFSMTIVLLNLLGVIALLIGLFVTIPMSVMAYVYVYRTLAKSSFSEALIPESTVPANEVVA